MRETLTFTDRTKRREEKRRKWFSIPFLDVSVTLIFVLKKKIIKNRNNKQLENEKSSRTCIKKKYQEWGGQWTLQKHGKNIMERSTVVTCLLLLIQRELGMGNIIFCNPFSLPSLHVASEGGRNKRRGWKGCLNQQSLQKWEGETPTVTKKYSLSFNIFKHFIRKNVFPVSKWKKRSSNVSTKDVETPTLRKMSHERKRVNGSLKAWTIFFSLPIKSVDTLRWWRRYQWDGKRFSRTNIKERERRSPIITPIKGSQSKRW